MTRWSKKDLTGILLNNQKDVKGDQWDLVEFPAILDHGSKKRTCLATILENGRARKGKSNTSGWKMERTMDAKTNF